jgi:hypothetical protein
MLKPWPHWFSARPGSTNVLRDLRVVLGDGGRRYRELLSLSSRTLIANRRTFSALNFDHLAPSIP